VQYYIDQLNSRGTNVIGKIIYNVKIHDYQAAQPFRFGPQLCDFYQCDLYHWSPPPPTRSSL
jgi:hypothetical protein